MRIGIVGKIRQLLAGILFAEETRPSIEDALVKEVPQVEPVRLTNYWDSRSRYVPHQGLKERARRRRQEQKRECNCSHPAILRVVKEE